MSVFGNVGPGGVEDDGGRELEVDEVLNFVQGLYVVDAVYERGKTVVMREFL